MSIEAMKQALDALYDIEATGVPVGHIDLVIDTLRTAIEHTEKQEPVAWRWKERINNDFDSWVISASEPPPYAIEQQPLYTAPPQRKPEQEPVAWAHKEGLEAIKDFDASIYANDGFDDAVPLYTTPPQRKPLTDEEIERACVPLGAAMLSFSEVARAIEAAHGIKE